MIQYYSCSTTYYVPILQLFYNVLCNPILQLFYNVLCPILQLFYNVLCWSYSVLSQFSTVLNAKTMFKWLQNAPLSALRRGEAGGGESSRLARRASKLNICTHTRTCTTTHIGMCALLQLIYSRVARRTSQPTTLNPKQSDTGMKLVEAEAPVWQGAPLHLILITYGATLSQGGRAYSATPPHHTQCDPPLFTSSSSHTVRPPSEETELSSLLAKANAYMGGNQTAMLPCPPHPQWPAIRPPPVAFEPLTSKP